MSQTAQQVPGSILSSDPDWWRGAVIYQVYPRSFQDTNGDGVGDLKGIAERLGHIAALGADAIWIAPFFKSPMKDFGYDVSDYCAVDGLFGTIEDFDHLIAEAHARGIRVLIDQVLSHSSDQHPWFKESRSSKDNAKADWYVWADAKPDGTPPNNWLSIFGGSGWEWDTTRCQYYLHNFLTSQPDLNFHTMAVQDALLDTVEFWLKRGVDGFRLDTVNFYVHSEALQDNPPSLPEDRNSPEAPAVNPYNWQDHIHDKSQPENLEFLKRLRALLDRYPGQTTVGEIGDGPRSLRTMAAYTSGGDKLHMCYTFDFLSPIFTKEHFVKRVTAFEAIVGDGWPCWAFSNHDIVRHVSRWTTDGDYDGVAKIAAAILLSLRGSVCLYQGEELGLTEADIAFEDLQDPYGIRFWPEFKGRDGCRTPMVWESNATYGGFSTGKPWLPVPQEHIARAANREDVDHQSVLALYRRMIAFRKAHPALIRGSIAFIDTPDDVLGFIRTTGDESVLAVFNIGTTAVTADLPPGIEVAPLDGHGFTATLHQQERTISLNGRDAFFARIV
ncbi:alpha-glucosidase family protein [Mesorhizobium sp. BR1-1-16]|uniref:beta-galactosidase BglA n=1 Tax=Mesorhizobium sp. BR1-1-16 TaxID=2876653 RepID=UPI001CCDCC85|nr:alpha-glucosidase [Mesorhizobium sp. BR1-1-16]MBZ9936084.1 alpha-glucosidase family protein [Mesorhizobium sp. BR1-1-16]